MRKPGFTLIELLVVIGIIALILGILVPSINKVRQIAKRTVCKAQLHSVAQAFRMYLDDNRNTMPPAKDAPWNYFNPGERISSKPAIIKYLGPYLSVPSAELAEPVVSGKLKKCYAKVLCCPADRRDSIAQYYFKIQQSSYWYNERLGGRILDKAAFRSHSPLKDMEVMGDFDAFHGKKLTATAGERYGENVAPPLGSYNYLFADCHVGDRKGY